MMNIDSAATTTATETPDSSESSNREACSLARGLPPTPARSQAGSLCSAAAETPDLKNSATTETPMPPTNVDTVIIANIAPCIEGGRYAVKRTVGDRLAVEADVFGDGHGKVVAMLQWRVGGDSEWRETPMRFVDNDRWHGEMPVEAMGFTEYRVSAWGDVFLAWCEEIRKKCAAGIADLQSEILEGSGLVAAAAERAEAVKVGGASCSPSGRVRAAARERATEPPETFE